MSHRGADHEVCLGWGSHADVVRQRLEQLAAPLLVSKGTGRQRYMQRYLEESAGSPDCAVGRGAAKLLESCRERRLALDIR